MARSSISPFQFKGKMGLLTRHTVLVGLICIPFFVFLGAEVSSMRTIPRLLKGSNPSKIPRIVHFITLGDPPPEYMLAMVITTADRVEREGFEVKIWRDEDAENLVQRHRDPSVIQAWEYLKVGPEGTKYHRMASFIRPLILFTSGGLLLDADVVPCEGVEFMFDDPGMVSFPFKNPSCADEEVNVGAVSSPPGHRLMEMVLDYFVSLGPDINTLHYLNATGPVAFATATDNYLKEMGVDMPPIHEGFCFFDEIEKIDNWYKVVDLRFRPPSETSKIDQLYNVMFGSWRNDISTIDNDCVKDPTLVPGFVEWFCKPDIRSEETYAFHHHCGANSHMSEMQ